ncbi:MAG: hypothetical protein AB8F74_05655, partial [Saprospiraceae bacterium]
SSWFYRSNGDLFVYNKIGVRCEIVGFSLDLAITRLDYGAEEESISESNGFTMPRTVCISFPF